VTFLVFDFSALLAQTFSRNQIGILPADTARNSNHSHQIGRGKFLRRIALQIEIVLISVADLELDWMISLKPAVLFSIIALSLFTPCSGFARRPGRTIVDFNDQWKFLQGDPAHAEQAAFNDSNWRAANVPYDWSIAGPVSETNPSGPAGGFFPTGVAWYRKIFSLSPEDAHRHVYIVFDGVMANSDVWINGVHLGQRPNGHVSFFYEPTGHVLFGASAHNCTTSLLLECVWVEGGFGTRTQHLWTRMALQSAPLRRCLDTRRRKLCGGRTSTQFQRILADSRGRRKAPRGQGFRYWTQVPTQPGTGDFCN
jgi:hypothetical protein